MFLLKCDTKSSAFNLKNANYLDMDRIISRNEYQPPVPPPPPQKKCCLEGILQYQLKNAYLAYDLVFMNGNSPYVHCCRSEI